MVRQGEYFVLAEFGRERRVPCVPGRGFDSFSAIAWNVYANAVQRDIQSYADRFAVVQPLIGVGVQPVMHVHGAQAAYMRFRQHRESMQERHRIHAATEPDNQRSIASAGKSGSGNEGRDRHRYIVAWCAPSVAVAGRGRGVAVTDGMLTVVLAAGQ